MSQVTQRWVFFCFVLFFFSCTTYVLAFFLLLIFVFWFDILNIRQRILTSSMCLCDLKYNPLRFCPTAGFCPRRHPRIPARKGTPRKVGWRCAARFPKPLPYLWPKSVIYPTLFITWPNIRYPIYDLIIKSKPCFRPALKWVPYCKPMSNYRKHNLWKDFAKCFSIMIKKVTSS